MLQIINIKKILYSIFIIFILILILANIFDVKWQFNREIDRISNLSLNEIKEEYGKDIYNLFLLSETAGYNEPMMSYFKLSPNKYYFNFMGNLYKEKRLIDSKLEGIEIEMHRIPFIRIEIIEFPNKKI